MYEENDEIVATYRKAVRVVKSCRTIPQLVSANRYVGLFKTKYPEPILYQSLEKLVKRYQLWIRLYGAQTKKIYKG